ncbi:MAG TPA: DUF456 domain-containing protein [Phycisphaerae bacterium]|nr:DUF456 domain-containing protein [Phycisphaerae bacterium]HNU45843.1 DUF456 domain-containing protein [Phycisphaerae bacterium]
MWDYAGIAAVCVACVVGIGLTAVRLPGTWLIALAASVYGWLSGWGRVSITSVAVLIGIAVVGEVCEALASAALAKRAGASRQALWGALAGGFAGMLLFSVPLPVIGTTIGAVLGCFTGALIGELLAQRTLPQGTRVGVVSAAGFVLGIALKTAIAFLMTAMVLAALLFD